MTLTIVGDVDQTIYAWNGADPDILANQVVDFYPDIQTVSLKVNYRSTRQIIDAASRLIAHNYSALGGPYAQALMKYVTARDDAPGSPIQFDWFESPEEEAEFVASKIKSLLDLGGKPGEIFVASRTRFQLAYLEGELSKRKVPYINIAGGSFWQQKHIMDVISYLRVIAEPENENAFKRIYNIGSVHNLIPFGVHKGEYSTTRYLGNDFLGQCCGTLAGFEKIDQKSRFFYHDSPRSGAKDLMLFIKELAFVIDTGSVAAAIRFINDECYKKYLSIEDDITDNDESEDGKLSDLDTVSAIATQFKTLPDFLAYVDKMIEAGAAAKSKNWSNFVVISTIHRLKGLERDFVFGIGWCEGFKKLKSGEYQPVGLLPHTYSMISPPRKGVFPSLGQGSIPDEVCLAFVAVTRARLQVYLSGFSSMNDWKMKPSRFIGWLGL